MTAEHGRGLKIIEAVVDNLQLTGNGRQGTTVHFEKTLEWAPGAAGQHLLSADVDGKRSSGPDPMSGRPSQLPRVSRRWRWVRSERAT